MDIADVLPPEATNPIVVELRYPPAVVAQADASGLQAEVARVTNAESYQRGKRALAQELGVDYITVLLMPKRHDWRHDGEGLETESREASAIVHLPPTVSRHDEKRVTRTVMKWVAASELGQLLLAQARGAGIAYVGARGIGYRSVGELSRIERPEFLPSVALLYEARKSPPASR